jgi:uncharacterized protein (TIGR02145 family)
MKKAKTIITITGVFMLLFSYENMSGNIDYSGGSNSDQTSSKSTQTVTKSTQTGSQATQTKTTSTQTTSNPSQTKTTSAQTTAKPAQTKTTSTQTTTKPAQTTTKSTQTQTKPAQTTTKSTQTKTKSTQTTTKSTQTKTKSTQTTTKSTQTKSKTEPDSKSKDSGTVRIGTQTWAVVNLNVITFRNGDSIPEAKTNKEWVEAGQSGKPAWCYYNNNPANGPKFGKLYNWYALNDPRGLAPAGWTLPGDADWVTLINYLGGPQEAGKKMKSITGWSGGDNGTNEIGFTAFPGGYRVENGTFLNMGSIGTWWSSTESKSSSAIDYYLALSGSLARSNNPKQRGESVRCLRN